MMSSTEQKGKISNMQKALSVLLIDPGSTRKEINEPIGICAIASYAEKFKKIPLSIQLIFLPIDELPTTEEYKKYDVVGVSTKIGSLEVCKKIVSNIEKINNQDRPLILFGDLIATFATKELLEIFNDAICVVGEGEYAFLELLELTHEFSNNKTIIKIESFKRDVPNLGLMINGTFSKTGSKLVDLSNCPPPLRSYANGIANIGGIIRGESSRGCAWGKCSFCAIQHKYCNQVQWRPINIFRIISELIQFSELGIKSPFYTDEDFVGNDGNRAIELANAIVNEKNAGRIDNNLNLYVDMRADSILAKSTNTQPSGNAVLKQLKNAGLREVFIGIESGSKEQVIRYKKASTAKRNLLVLNTLKTFDLTYDVGFIMFDPEMTIHELNENINFIKSAGLNYHDSRLTKSLRIEPGTPIVSDYSEKGMIIGDLDIDQLIFPYRWCNSNTQEAYEAFSNWENVFADDVYTIQASTRGEVQSESIRSEWRKKLGNIRAIEIEALSSISRGLIEKNNINTESLKILQETKHNLITEAIATISYKN